MLFLVLPETVIRPSPDVKLNQHKQMFPAGLISSSSDVTFHLISCIESFLFAFPNNSVDACMKGTDGTIYMCPTKNSLNYSSSHE